MKNNYANRMRAAIRDIELESLKINGPQHGKSATMRSTRDKARCPRLQRKNRDWNRGE